MWEILFSDVSGKLYDAPGLGLIGRTGNSFVEPLAQEMIPLPPGATLSMIPQRHPVAIDLETDEFISVTTNPYEEKGGEIFAGGRCCPRATLELSFPPLQEVRTRGTCPYWATPCAASRMDRYMWQPLLLIRTINGVPAILIPRIWVRG